MKAVILFFFFFFHLHDGAWVNFGFWKLVVQKLLPMGFWMVFENLVDCPTLVISNPRRARIDRNLGTANATQPPNFNVGYYLAGLDEWTKKSKLSPQNFLCHLRFFYDTKD